MSSPGWSLPNSAQAALSLSEIIKAEKYEK